MTFRAALYGSGVLPQRKRAELKALYPNLAIKSYFAATQAETIGLQLTQESPLASVPGLHLIEIVDSKGRWVAEGEEGELVVTRLHAHEAPFPRFKVGDRMVRRPNLDRPDLKAQQFDFAGRSGDVIHIGDTQYSAPQAYLSLCRELRATGVFDLEVLAHEMQFVNSREAKLLSLIVSVDNADYWSNRLIGMLGAEGVRHSFIQALMGSLSLFNQGEANFYSIERAGYKFDIRLVPKWSHEIFRTELGKVPLIRDIVISVL